MLLEVYRCVQLKRWSVVCGCVLHRGQRGEGWCVSSTLCRYDIRMGLLLVLSWARVRRVSLGRESSVLVLGWTQCLPQGVGAPPAMLRGRTAGFPKKLGGRASGEAE